MRRDSGWVIDASVAAKWYLRDEEFIPEADTLREGYRDGSLWAIAPHLSRYEVASAIVLASRLGRLSSAMAAREIENYLRLDLHQERDPNWLIQEARRIALELQVGFYDATYLSLAESLGLPLVTADKKLYDGVKDKVPYVRWIGDLTATENNP